MARKIMTISINPKMEERIRRSCEFRGWTTSRWAEEAFRFQIMADEKARLKEEASMKEAEERAKMRTPANMTDDELKATTERLIREMQNRELQAILKTEWIEK